jgi:DNA-binding MarR family transcriptional regulator
LTALYALNILGGITNTQILQFVIDNSLMDYFALQGALGDLETAGYIAKEPHPLGELLRLSEDGRQALALFEKRIPVSRRLLIDQTAPVWRSRFGVEKELIATAHPLPDGGTQIELMIRQDRRYMLIILINLPDNRAAAACMKTFKRHADEVYASLFRELSRGYVPGMRTFADMPDGATSVKGQGDLVEMHSEGFSVILPLTDSDMACHFAQIWKREHVTIRLALIRRLGG